MNCTTKTTAAERPPGRAGRMLLLSALVAGLSVGLAGAARADHIDERLRDEAPKILKYLKDHNYHTVGVLKFSVQKGSAAPSLNAGVINTKMATRLEHALIMLNDPAKPISVLHDASKTAAASRAATFRNAKGRRDLLAQSYPVAWGSEKKQPDVFLTGDVVVSKDMKKLTVIVKAFDKKNPDKMQEVARLANVPTDRNILANMGQSFVLSRGKLARGARDADDLAAADAANRDNSNLNPLQDPEEPIKLEIFYDDQPVALEPDSASPGELRLRKTKAADPKEGQKVKFVMTNVSKEKVAAVLAINGKNTLFQEDLATRSPDQCTKWVLAPGEKYTIEGFYLEGGKVLAFKVLSDEESMRVELSPEHKGVFSLFVFREATGLDSGLSIAGPADSDLARGPKDRGKSLRDLQAGLQRVTHNQVQNGKLVADKSKPRSAPKVATQKKGRGLVVEGEETTGKALNRVDFKLDPQPAVALFIRYWQGPIDGPPPAP